MKNTLLSAALSALVTTTVVAQQAEPLPNPKAAFAHPIVLGPDDKLAFDAPPAGFNTPRKEVPHGRLEMVEYDSKSVGVKRRMQVYTPPGYSKETRYPVLWLLHGIGGG